ncbi:glycerophosphodiester phosphodiesterase family protein [Paenibacillus sp. LHD-117]|uniref:glycerophosphodiester phosphodiesterase family protein n=1 Tax=Paenibacillus sp. LHD-117 TaxID=3071412 RepID=UPI0027DF7D04|nr:glycerophosphodiester phosphodiesterase family protein [Paenibacillus sp. LHD-117]MDQ6421572.1 glycerophosphodiester phosphodiesterase family protein [Paenibacillus sp. LHD-117]
MPSTKTLTPPVIDGRTEEAFWTVQEPMTVKLGEGPAAEGRFGLLWDHAYLYVAVDVADDKLVHDGAGHWFEQDNIGLFFDPSNHKSAPFVNDDMQIGIGYQPGTSTPSFHFGAAPNHAGKDEKEVLRAIRKTDSGWSGEIAVPWEMLNLDPNVTRSLGFDIGVTDRDDPLTPGSTMMWNAYNSVSFWNDTSGYGNLALDDSSPVSGHVSDVLLEETFDGYASGESPYGWISDTNAGSAPMTVQVAEDGNGSLLFDGNAAGKQARISAPVQWDDYIIEADVSFEGVLNGGRWAAILFRGASNGKQPYNQMAVRQNGMFEIAYRKPDNSWSVPASGQWKQPLELNKIYTLKVRAVGNNVKEYIKSPEDANYELLMDQTLTANLLKRGKVGFQADQSKVRFDNLKVTRVYAVGLEGSLPDTLEALTGPVELSFSASFSDGIHDPVPSEKVKLYTSDDTVIQIIDHRLYPVGPGQATVTAVYGNVRTERQIEVTPSATGPQITALDHAEGYLLADAGSAIGLSDITFQAKFNDLTSGQVTGDRLEWNSASPNVYVDGGKLNVLEKGVHTVTAKSGAATVTLLVVAKATTEHEYVLYEENFDETTDGTLPTGWRRIEGATASNAAVSSGAFVMDALAAPNNPSRVLLPDYLKLFGNYLIEADMTHMEANDNARWHSLMFRIQNADYPYYQMAVRQNATAVNGVEFAERTPANGWNVMDKGSHTEAIAAGKMYRYAVKAYGNRVQEWIDGTLVVNSDTATAYAKGGIGLQANGSKLKADNIKVTLLTKPLPPMPAEKFVNVSEPDTRVAMAPSVIAEIDTIDQWKRLTADGATDLPATVILHVNRNLDVTEGQGRKTIGSLDDVLKALNNLMIPAFYVEDERTVSRLADYLRSNGVEDAFVISDQPELVKLAREAYPIARGIVEFDVKGKGGRLSEQQLMDIRRTTNRSMARIALLPQDAATTEQVAYLQERLITVWAKEEEKRDDERIVMHRLIARGVNGIVTDSPASAIRALEAYDHGLALVRKPIIVAHRGIPSLAPENTMEGFKLAYEYGADVLENDIFLSKDGHLVIMHDPTLDRTTTGTGNVEDYTLEQLKSFKANKQFPQAYPDARIPTLAEVFDAFKGKDVQHFVEIKSYKPEIVDALVKLIKEKRVENQVSVISFNDAQLKRLGGLMPEMSIGFLTGGYANEANVNKSLRETLKVIQNLDSTFNSSYPGIGPKFMEAAKHRGITLWPWTFRNLDETVRYYGMGTHSLTTDYAQWASDWAVKLAPEKTEYKIKKGEMVRVSAIAETQLGKTNKVSPEIVVIDGGSSIKVEGNEIVGVKKGTARVMFRHTSNLNPSTPYDLYSEPVEIRVR